MWVCSQAVCLFITSKVWLLYVRPQKSNLQLWNNAENSVAPTKRVRNHHSCLKLILAGYIWIFLRTACWIFDGAGKDTSITSLVSLFSKTLAWFLFFYDGILCSVSSGLSKIRAGNDLAAKKEVVTPQLSTMKPLAHFIPHMTNFTNWKHIRLKKHLSILIF